MKKIVLGFSLVTFGVWILGFWLVPPANHARALVHEIHYVTGLLAWGYMALAIAIAARPSWLERVTKTGLDKLYLWHRYLGIGAVVLSIVHYFGRQIGEVVLSGMTLDPVPAMARSGEGLPMLQALWVTLRTFLVDSSLWLTLVVIALTALCFVKAISYTKWLKTHRLFPILFLLLVPHSILLMEPSDAFTPLGWLNVAVTAFGVYYSIICLKSGVGKEKSVTSKIVNISVKNGVSRLSIKSDIPMKVIPGQFVFLTSRDGEKHPFSVAGIDSDGTIELLVKALGDYTTDEVPQLKIGDTVTIEGPWGRFVLDKTAKRQEWVAAGIGIAPFCAWLASLGFDRTNDSQIRLHWCVKDRVTEPMMAQVQELAARAKVQLSVYDKSVERFDPKAMFGTAMPDVVAVCAGQKMADSVGSAWNATGRNGKLMREFFDWR